MTSIPQNSIRLTLLAGISLALTLGACSSSSSGGKENGGSPGGGTAVEGGSTTSVGGTVANGGSTATPDTGGTIETGGNTQPSGGSTVATSATGGNSTSGGSTAAGGFTAAGGSSVAGGSTTAGGTTSAAGTTATGGRAGGSTAVAGATGGSSAVGGTPGGSSAIGGKTGGTTATGGTTGGSSASGGRTGGTTSSGGSTVTGGTTATGGSTGAAGNTATSGRNPAMLALVKAMSPGWNLGNSFDGSPKVTSWGNPAPNQTLINAVHAAGFNLLRLPVTWGPHLGASPSYTIDATWMASVVQTAQWAIDAGMYVFVNTHHDGWVTFPADPTPVAAESGAVWKQIATAFAGFSSKLMFECFNEPSGGGTALNSYVEACVNAVRGTGGANATRVVMIQGQGASPSSTGISTMLKISVINDPNLVFSVHTYEPTNFGLGNNAVAWGSASDYDTMKSSVTQILGWLPNWGIVIGEWGSMGVQVLADRVTHAHAYSRDTAAAGMCPVWWDNGGSGKGSYAIFDRTTGAQTEPTIVNAIVTGTQEGLANPGTYATSTNP